LHHYGSSPWSSVCILSKSFGTVLRLTRGRYLLRMNKEWSLIGGLMLMKRMVTPVVLPRRRWTIFGSDCEGFHLFAAFLVPGDSS